MIKRVKFSTENIKKIDELLQEGVREIVANVADEAYPDDAPREIQIKLIFRPDKSEPSEFTVEIHKNTKFPKRWGKKITAVIRSGEMLVEEQEETQVTIFDTDSNVTLMRKEH